MLSLRFEPIRCLGALACILGCLVACGGEATQQIDGSGNSDGGRSGASGGAGSGGESTGGLSSGGVSTGGSGAGGVVIGVGGTSVGGFGAGGTGSGGGILGACNVNSDCVAVFDNSNSCSCKYPFAASRADVAGNRCLVPWEERDSARPACSLPDPDEVCLELPCVPPPGCVNAWCNQGTCEVIDGYSPEECAVPDDCEELAERRRSTLDAARACDPTLSSISCDASQTVPDVCGCPVVVNERYPELVQAALAAADNWFNSSCPVAPCPPIACSVPTSGSCTTDGVCAGL